MAKLKYIVVEGKHNTGTGFVRAGEALDLEEEEAAKFPGKFRVVTTPQMAEAEPEPAKSKGPIRKA